MSIATASNGALLNHVSSAVLVETNPRVSALTNRKWTNHATTTHNDLTDWPLSLPERVFVIELEDGGDPTARRLMFRRYGTVKEWNQKWPGMLPPLFEKSILSFGFGGGGSHLVDVSELCAPQVSNETWSFAVFPSNRLEKRAIVFPLKDADNIASPEASANYAVVHSRLDWNLRKHLRLLSGTQLSGGSQTTTIDAKRPSVEGASVSFVPVLVFVKMPMHDATAYFEATRLWG